jgi:hypothetical protein
MTVQNLGVITPLCETDAGSRLGIDWPRAVQLEPRGVWTDRLTLGREGEMKWRVMVELS